MRTKAEGIGIAQEQRPQVWEQPTLAIWRRYAKLRTQLYPYLVAADREYRRTGMPIMRHLALTHPDDRAAATRHDQLMFGPSLLAAPVLEPGRRERQLYLPRGSWVDLWGSAEYRERSGALRLGEARVLGGHRSVTLPAPLAELPLLARAGALIPMLPADVDTLAPYGRKTPGVVRLRDRDRRLRVLAFPRGRSAASFLAAGRLRSVERQGSWRLTVESPHERRYAVQASLRTLRAPFRPRSVEVDGRRIRSWDYEHETGVLGIRVRARSAQILVR
jgi:hypothetical protein